MIEFAQTSFPVHQIMEKDHHPGQDGQRDGQWKKAQNAVVQDAATDFFWLVLESWLLLDTFCLSNESPYSCGKAAKS